MYCADIKVLCNCEKVAHMCQDLCKHVKTVQACATLLPGHGSLCTWQQVCGGISFGGKHIEREIDAGKYCQISLESAKNQSKGQPYQIEEKKKLSNPNPNI